MSKDNAYNKITIVPYTVEYTDVLIEIGSWMHAESSYSHMNYDREKLIKLGPVILSNPDKWCCIMALKGSEPIGLFIGYMSDNIFGGDLISKDFILYVALPHRGGRAGLMLIRAYEKWAADNGATEIQMGITTDINMEKTQKLYERLGYSVRGVLMKKSET